MTSSSGVIAYNDFFEKPAAVHGTLYTLPTNVSHHRIFLYTSHSESLQEAAARFWLMHHYPFVAGGYAGRFLRASYGLELVKNNTMETEFSYSLDEHGCLKVIRYDALQNKWTVVFKDNWYALVNQYYKNAEHLYSLPGFKGRSSKIMAYVELKAKIENLKHLCYAHSPSKRFNAYLQFVDKLKKNLQKKFDSK